MSDDINRVPIRVVKHIHAPNHSVVAATLAPNSGAVPVTSKPGRERPPNRPWGQGPGPRAGSLTSRRLSGACHSRGEGRRARSVRERYAGCPQRQRAAGEILKACGSDRRLWTTAIEANR